MNSESPAASPAPAPAGTARPPAETHDPRSIAPEWRQRRLTRASVWLVRLVVGGLFLYAGAFKAWDPAQFQLEVERYQLVPPVVAWLTAAYLPYLELLAGGALWHRRWEPAGRFVLATLLVVFIAGLASAWMRGLNITCGCFGQAATGEAPNYPWWIGRDLILLALLGWLHVNGRRPRRAA